MAEYRKRPKAHGYRRRPIESFRATGGADPFAETAPCPEAVLILATEDTDTFTAYAVVYEEYTGVMFSFDSKDQVVADSWTSSMSVTPGPESVPDGFTSAGDMTNLGSTIV